MAKKKRHHPPPISSQSYKAPDPLPTSTQLVVKGPNQAAGLGRFILTKAYRCEENLTDLDFQVLWLLLEYFRRIKFTYIYKENEYLFSYMAFAIKELVNFEKHLPDMSAVHRLRGFLAPGVLMDPREYAGRLGDHSYEPSKFIKLMNPNRVRRERRRRFIGVGYRDKGNTVLPHQNGAPTWRELSRTLVDYDLETYYLSKKYDCLRWPAYLVPPEVYDRIQKLPQPVFAELELVHSSASPRPFYGRYFTVSLDNRITRKP